MTRRSRGIPHTSQPAAFPLGGIGTGNVSLGARGELRDWELENLPDKGRCNPYSFFAIHARPEGAEPVTRVLEARLTGRHDADAGYPFESLAGLPRLAGATMRGEYPVVDIDFHDDILPVAVSMRAFTPLVPLDPDSSGIPAAVLRYTVTNTAAVPVDVTVVGSVSHTAGRGEGTFGMRAPQTVRWRDDGGVRGLDFGIELPEDDFGYGTLSLTTADAATTAKPQWVTGFWPDGPRLFWNDLAADGRLEPEQRLTLEDRPRGLFAESADGRVSYTEQELLEKLPRIRTGSLGIVHELAPGDSRDFEFVLAWSFPNRHRGWLGHIVLDGPHRDEVVQNHYATLWADAWAAASYLHRELPSLEKTTLAFVEALYGGTLDPAIVDAVGANIAAVRSTMCFVVETPNPALGDGPVFAAWEGSFDHGGSCEGTCTHVWSYAQTVAWLFPSLERSARRVEYLLETDAAGAQKFRSNRVFDGPSWFMGPAADGQLGTLLRLHREWRFSGDDEFLRELWPAADRMLDYTIHEWDRDGDGLLDGELHNTYDIEFHGVEPLANGMFVAALRAGARMASHLGAAERAAELTRRAEHAAAGMDHVLWNGEYYRQVIDDVDAHRYQYGEGVLSDQLLGQFHAYVNGLGDLLPAERIRGALAAVVACNFRDDLRAHESTQRVYALNEEGGLLLASWPRGGRPAIPFVYSDEVWTGIEHQVAASLVYAGLTDDALRIERALRSRYDGTARNPWNEIECGNHYARSLASWALLLAFTGAQWDAPTRSLAFTPAGDRPVRALFTTGTAWGRVEIERNAVTVHVDGGVLDLDRLVLRGHEASGPLRIAAGESRTAIVDPSPSGDTMTSYALPATPKRPEAAPKTAYLVASGDLRESANTAGWPTQVELEDGVTRVITDLGWTVVRANDVDPKTGHGFISSQRMGLEVFKNIPPDAPLIVAEAVWQYSHHVLAGLRTHRGPILTVANFAGRWPGLVGLLGLNAGLTKMGKDYSTIWSVDFTDDWFRDGLKEWTETGRITHDESHVRPLPALPDTPEVQLGRALGDQLLTDKAIIGVFDEGCMGMYNAIFDDELLNRLGIYKERLSQSALYAEMLRVPDAEADEAYAWLTDRGMTFRYGADAATELTRDQVQWQLKMYIAALRIADDFGLDAMGIQYQQGLKDLVPASDLAEGLLNSTDRPPVLSRDGSRELHAGRAFPHFNEADEGVAVDALVTDRVWRAMGLVPDNTLHDVRWGEDYDGEFVWVYEISGSVPGSHLAGWDKAEGWRQHPVFFPAGGSTINGVSKPGEIVISRVFIADGVLQADVFRGTVVELPVEETQRRKDATNPEWPIAHVVLHGISRDQFMARHKANHAQLVYAPDAETADKALAAKAAMFDRLGIKVHLTGEVKL